MRRQRHRCVPAGFTRPLAARCTAGRPSLPPLVPSYHSAAHYANQQPSTRRPASQDFPSLRRFRLWPWRPRAISAWMTALCFHISQLGPSCSTALVERSPFFSADARQLFFSPLAVSSPLLLLRKLRGSICMLLAARILRELLSWRRSRDT